MGSFRLLSLGTAVLEEARKNPATEFDPQDYVWRERLTRASETLLVSFVSRDMGRERDHG